jgi:ABC-type polysaccharide/polyol phosphate export permease
MIPWQFFDAVLKQGSRSIIRNQSLIRKIYIPKLVFPVADIGNELFNLLFSLCAMFLLLQLIGAGIHIQLVLLPLALFCLTLFSLGITLLLMVLTTFYRDVEHMIDVLLRLLYFLSPILWETERFAGRAWYFDAVIKLNPMTYMLGPFHSIFRYGQWPPLNTWIVAVSLALISSICGYVVYKRYENKLIFRI